jgi:hypothetical protein
MTNVGGGGGLALATAPMGRRKATAAIIRTSLVMSC